MLRRGVKFSEAPPGQTSLDLAKLPLFLEGGQGHNSNPSDLFHLESSVPTEGLRVLCPSFQDLPEHHSVTSSKVIGPFDKVSFVSQRRVRGKKQTHPTSFHVEFSVPTEGLRA